MNYAKKIAIKNKSLYFKLSLIKKIGLNLYFINFIFQQIFRRHSKLNLNVNFTSSIWESGITFNRDITTLASFAISGHCYFQAINGIKLGKECLFAPGVKLISSNHDFKNYSHSIDEKPIIIGDNVWIGTNVVILPGVEIGNNCVVGAGSIVTKSFKQNNLIIAGNPAKIIRIKNEENIYCRN